MVTGQELNDDAARMRQEEADYQREVREITERAKADGTFMKAPNGKPSNLDERQWAHVRTTRFKKWFGDWENDPENSSKVVDENGEPKVVYHGTGFNFTVFDTPPNMPRIFTSSSLDFAEGYGQAMKLFANIRNPLTMDFEGRDAFELVNIDGRQLDDIEELTLYAGKNGYDGVVARNVSDVGTHTSTLKLNDEYIVIRPNQLKSATENVGTYDINDNDIRFAI